MNQTTRVFGASEEAGKTLEAIFGRVFYGEPASTSPENAPGAEPGPPRTCQRARRREMTILRSDPLPDRLVLLEHDPSENRRPLFGIMLKSSPIVSCHCIGERHVEISIETSGL